MGLLAADLHFPPDILISFAIYRFYFPQGLFSRKFRHVPYGVNKLENTPSLLGADPTIPPEKRVSFCIFETSSLNGIKGNEFDACAPWGKLGA